MQARGRDERVHGALFQGPEPADVLVDRPPVGQAVGQQALPEARAVRRVAPADHRGHLKPRLGWLDLRQVDDLAAVEHSVVCGLPESLRQMGQHGPDPADLVEVLVIREGEFEEPVTKTVFAVTILLDEPGTAQCAERPVNARLRRVQPFRQIVESYPIRKRPEEAQCGEYPVRPVPGAVTRYCLLAVGLPRCRSHRPPSPCGVVRFTIVLFSISDHRSNNRNKPARRGGWKHSSGSAATSSASRTSNGPSQTSAKRFSMCRSRGSAALICTRTVVLAASAVLHSSSGTKRWAESTMTTGCSSSFRSQAARCVPPARRAARTSARTASCSASTAPAHSRSGSPCPPLRSSPFRTASPPTLPPSPSRWPRRWRCSAGTS